MQNCFLRNMSTSLEPIIKISCNLARKYFSRKSCKYGVLKKLNQEIQDIPVEPQQGIIKAFSPSAKLLSKWCQLTSIVTSLFHANYKNNVITRFSTIINKLKPILTACLYLYMLPWQKNMEPLFLSTIQLLWKNLIPLHFYRTLTLVHVSKCE